MFFSYHERLQKGERKEGTNVTPCWTPDYIVASWSLKQSFSEVNTHTQYQDHSWPFDGKSGKAQVGFPVLFTHKLFLHYLNIWDVTFKYMHHFPILFSVKQHLNTCNDMWSEQIMQLLFIQGPSLIPDRQTTITGERMSG